MGEDVEILLALGIPSIIVSIWIAVWQNRKAKRAQAQFEGELANLPERVSRTVRAVIEAAPSQSADSLTNPEWPSAIDYADVDNDGKTELLVQYLAGAHGNALQVFGWRDREFKKIAALGVGTPVPFEFGDFDGDGLTEIKGTETDWSVGLPYSMAPRVEVLYRWDGNKFREVSRKKGYTAEELRTLLDEARREGITIERIDPDSA